MILNRCGGKSFCKAMTHNTFVTLSFSILHGLYESLIVYISNHHVTPTFIIASQRPLGQSIINRLSKSSGIFLLDEFPVSFIRNVTATDLQIVW